MLTPGPRTTCTPSARASSRRATPTRADEVAVPRRRPGPTPSGTRRRGHPDHVDAGLLAEPWGPSPTSIEGTGCGRPGTVEGLREPVVHAESRETPSPRGSARRARASTSNTGRAIRPSFWVESGCSPKRREHVLLALEELVEHRDPRGCGCRSPGRGGSPAAASPSTARRTHRRADDGSIPGAGPREDPLGERLHASRQGEAPSTTSAGTSTTMSSGRPGMGAVGDVDGGRSRSTPHATHSMIGIASSSDDSSGDPRASPAGRAPSHRPRVVVAALRVDETDVIVPLRYRRPLGQGEPSAGSWKYCSWAGT